MAQLDSQKGLSISGALVALLITGLAFAVLSQYLSITLQATGGVQNSLDFQILRTNIEHTLKNSKLCVEAFRGATFVRGQGLGFPSATSAKVDAGAQDLTEQRMAPFLGSPLLAVQGQNLGGGLVVTSLQVRPTGQDFSRRQLPVELTVEATRKNGFGGSVKKYSNSQNPFRFTVRLDEENRISECSSVSIDSNSPSQSALLVQSPERAQPSITCTKNFGSTWWNGAKSFLDGQSGSPIHAGDLMRESNVYGASNYFFQFTASDCGGALPPQGSIGSFGTQFICGGAGPSAVLNPGQSLDPNIRLASGMSGQERTLIPESVLRGPGVYFNLTNFNSVCIQRAQVGSAGVVSVVYVLPQSSQ